MQIATGNFSNVKKYQAKGFFPISIALSAKYFNGYTYAVLNPEWGYMNDAEPSYTQKFNKGLERLSAQKVYADLIAASKGKNIVLLCHEKEGDFCHRSLVALWLTKELGIEVLELGKMEVPVLINTQTEMFV
jgi:uncharacterized protein (DUF488 family)